MKLKYLLFVLFSVNCFASGNYSCETPLVPHTDNVSSEREFQNIYQCMSALNAHNVTISTLTVTSSATIANLTATSATITNLTVSTLNGSAVSFHLLQAPVFASETTGCSTNSTSFIDCGASTSITLGSASSKVLVIAIAPAFSGTSNAVSVLGVSSGGSDLVARDASPARYASAANNVGDLVFVWLDSPAASGSRAYKMRAAVNSNTSSFGSAAASGSSTLLALMEVQ